MVVELVARAAEKGHAMVLVIRAHETHGEAAILLHHAVRNREAKPVRVKRHHGVKLCGLEHHVLHARRAHIAARIASRWAGAIVGRNAEHHAPALRVGDDKRTIAKQRGLNKLHAVHVPCTETIRREPRAQPGQGGIVGKGVGAPGQRARRPAAHLKAAQTAPQQDRAALNFSRGKVHQIDIKTRKGLRILAGEMQVVKARRSGSLQSGHDRGFRLFQTVALPSSRRRNRRAKAASSAAPKTPAT